ncbi:putative trans-sialidase, Group V [Trypanosoma cruzi]|uniref:Trans-sialidase, putative n=2 Tax=Trypanosoma cruzi TaxID=5693 RepID=Q4D129_TRYCC|nr:trans-sialidase, putative [Trypanosoma cruzi]EAN86230.1 trans-sialidase, putative [Trypanosoma cruzi]PWV20710.1 putative trans-sialidase, Group V [Trypanosoma cruzi]|eukprot:XP_808081.1 trans-sialidase [Trypanosoma cruzi strain CL Brener]
MLSRVAAVKAPRTHNRRRVTGSSGRRREGGESEPQTPTMSRHLFYSAVLLLVVVMMCCNAGGAAEAPEQSPEHPFEWKHVKEEGGVTVESLGAPSLLKVGIDVFAVAEAKETKMADGSFTGIASQLLTETVKKKDNTPVEIMKDANTKTQFLEKSTSPNSKVDVSRPTTIVKGNDIYMLVGKYNRDDAQESGGGDSGLLLVKGNVSEEHNKKIDWKNTESLPRGPFDTEPESLTGLFGGGGSGVKMHDDTLVFPVEGTKKGNKKDVKTVSLIISSPKDTSESWKLSNEVPYDGCSDPSVVEWGEKEKKLMMMTACDDGRRRVYESGDKGESWTEALGTLSRVWSNKHGEGVKAARSGFITAKIDDRDVMLVTLPVYPEKDGKKENGELHLWLTDNTHIVDIGPVSDDDAAASSLLYRSGKSGDNKEEEKFIALYEKKKEDEKPSPGMVYVLLTEQLQRVKDVLATWKEVDERVSKLCTSSAEKDASSVNACGTTVKITDGLVGFLSDNFSESTWSDEYLGVNATVRKKEGAAKNTRETGATKTSDGVKFHGAWAEWPVGSQGENQLYHFANYKFTLVATVSIDGVPEGDTPIPLMGVKMNDSGKTVLLGLSYNKEKKWKLSCGGGSIKEHSNTWKTKTSEHVVILLRNGSQGSAYVDGHRVGGDPPCALGNTDSKKISHFYIGGDGGAKADSEVQDVSMTVSNVLLYNRPLSSEEVGAFNPNKDSTPPLEKEAAKPSAVSSGSVVSSFPPVSAAAQKTETSSTAGTQPTEKGQSMGSSGAGNGSASAPAVSTVSTSPAEEESVVQVTSGTSPDGNQTVGGGSTADGEPTMETREGTDVQEEEIHAQHGEVKAAALSSSLGNVSQRNNSDAGTVCGSGLLPLLLLLGLWVFAAL